MSIPRDRIDAILDAAHTQGRETIELRDRKEADEMVDALLERAESLVDSEQAIACSGHDLEDRYLLHVHWVARQGPTS
jgi:hypothetical protein